MLFVDYDDAEVVERGEYRRPRADDDSRVAVLDATPLVGAFPFGEARMKDRDRLAKLRPQAA